MDTVIAYRSVTFAKPLFLTHAPDGTDRVFVAEQTGRIYVFPDDEMTTQRTLFLDLSDVAHGQDFEEGLLGLCFDPAYSTNGYLYVHYSYRPASTTYSRISRFQVSPGDPNIADRNSELLLLDVEQPFANHNGGMLAFGPDGYLYISLGDGGGANDQLGNAQNLSTLLGSLLRIDVHNTQGSLNYAIPADNPFVSAAGARGEIFAYGLRHPWRFSFDRSDGTLWLGDVGQQAREEVDIIVKGGNYGWIHREGFATHLGTPPQGFQPIDPIVDYPPSLGHAVIGGSAIPESDRAGSPGDTPLPSTTATDPRM